MIFRAMGQIFAGVETARGAVRQRTDEGLVTGDDLAEGIAVARETGLH